MPEGVIRGRAKVIILGAGAATSAGPVCTGLPHPSPALG